MINKPISNFADSHQHLSVIAVLLLSHLNLFFERHFKKVSQRMSANSNGWAMAIVYLNVVLYATCYQIQRPLEPYMVDKLNLNTETDSADEYAKLQSFFSIVQVVYYIL